LIEQNYFCDKCPIVASARPGCLSAWLSGFIYYPRFLGFWKSISGSSQKKNQYASMPAGILTTQMKSMRIMNSTNEIAANNAGTNITKNKPVDDHIILGVLQLSTPPP